MAAGRVSKCQARRPPPFNKHPAGTATTHVSDSSTRFTSASQKQETVLILIIQHQIYRNEVVRQHAGAPHFLSHFCSSCAPSVCAEIRALNTRFFFMSSIVEAPPTRLQGAANQKRIGLIGRS